MKRARLAFVGVLFAMCSSSSGCNGKAGASHETALALGEACMADQSLVGTSIVSPAADCASNDCLFQPPSGAVPAHATCTKACTQDSDCAAQDGAACPGGLACAVAMLTGSFACTKMCVCRGDLIPGLNVDGNGALITPEACGGDPDQGSAPADFSQSSPHDM